MLQSIAIVAIALIASVEAFGETITAVCPEPKGRASGWRGDVGKRAAYDNPDGFTGGHVTIIWETDSPRARILTKADSSGPTLSEFAVETYRSKEQVSFVVQYPPIGIYLYSL